MIHSDKKFKGLSSGTRNFIIETSKARAPRYEPQSARTTLPTNFYEDELIRDEPQHANPSLTGMCTCVWVRPRTATRVELIRGYTGTKAAFTRIRIDPDIRMSELRIGLPSTRKQLKCTLSGAIRYAIRSCSKTISKVDHPDVPVLFGQV